MPGISVRVRTKPPYASAEGVVRVIAEPLPTGGAAVRLEIAPELVGTNPMTPRSRTDPIFLVDNPQAGFDRASAWIAEHFEILGYEDD